ncbi:MAG TPA: response regulator transcription factor [Stellaceae bacterium]
MSESRVPIPVLVVAAHSLLREGMKAFLASSGYQICEVVDTIETAVERKIEDVGLALVAAELDDAVVEPLKALRSAYPQCRIVCYAQRFSLPANALVELFASSLDGCLSPDASLDVLRQSLDLIMVGETVFPSALIHAAQPHGEFAHPEGPAGNGPFSERERQVLANLAHGNSNKFIARTLQISEATVKVHIKTLLRKIGASNRTQAAIWATRHRVLESHHRPGERPIQPIQRD